MRPAASDTALARITCWRHCVKVLPSSVRNSRATVRRLAPVSAPRPPAWCGAWGRPARLRTTGAGACRGAGPPSFTGAARASSSHSRALRWRSRSNVAASGGGPSSGVVGISRTTARNRSGLPARGTGATRRLPMWHSALAPQTRWAAAPRAAGESHSDAHFGVFHHRHGMLHARRYPQRARWRHDVGAPVHRQLDHAGGGECHLCPRVAVRHHPRVGPQLAHLGAHRALGRGHKQVRGQ